MLLKMTIKDLREYIFGNYYKRLGFAKEEDSYYLLKKQSKRGLEIFSTKLTKKIPDPSRAKDHDLFLKTK